MSNPIFVSRALIKTDDFDVHIVPNKKRVRVTLKVSSKGVFLHIPTPLPMDIAYNLIEEKNRLDKTTARQTTGTTT